MRKRQGGVGDFSAEAPFDACWYGCSIFEGYDRKMKNKTIKNDRERKNEKYGT